MSNLTDNIAFVENWAFYTSKLLANKRRQLKVYDSGDLEASEGYTVGSVGSMIRVEFFFLARGRWVDMGAGRKPNLNGRYQASTETPKGRKPKKHYSKPFYGRLNSLNEALSTQVAEEVLNSNARVFKQKGSFTMLIAA